MAIYLTRCNDCGDREGWADMAVAATGVFQCPECGDPATKIYTVPADHSANTFRARWSDNLSATADPVYVSTQRDYQHLKAKCGVTEWEPGMTQDKIRHRKEDHTKLVTNLTREAMKELHA